MAKLLSSSCDRHVRINDLRLLDPLKLLSAVAEVTGSSRNNSSSFTTSLNMVICWPSLRRHAITVAIVTAKGSSPLGSATASDVCDLRASCRRSSWRIRAGLSMSYRQNDCIFVQPHYPHNEFL